MIEEIEVKDNIIKELKSIKKTIKDLDEKFIRGFIMGYELGCNVLLSAHWINVILGEIRNESPNRLD